MISAASFAACLLTLFISLIGPLLILLIFGIRYRKQGFFTAWLLGAAGFFVTQILIRIPLLGVLSGNAGFVSFSQQHVFLYGLGLAFTAGLFELAGRLAAVWAMKKNLTYRRAVAAGLGHGGIEAILLVGVTYINNLIFMVLIQTGSFDALIAQAQAAGTDPAQLTAIRDTLLATGAGLFLLSGLERLLTMVIHTGMSVLVCWGVKTRHTLLGSLGCLAIHTLLDSMVMVTLFLSLPLSYWVLYGFMGILALACLYLLRQLRLLWPAQ